MNQNFIRFHMSKSSRLPDFREVPRTWCKSSPTVPVALPLHAIALMPAVALQWLGFKSITSIHQYSHVFISMLRGIWSRINCIWLLFSHSAGFVESSKGVTFCHCGKRSLGLTVSVAIFLQPHCLGLSHPEKNEGNL